MIDLTNRVEDLIDKSMSPYYGDTIVYKDSMDLKISANNLDILPILLRLTITVDTLQKEIETLKEKYEQTN